MNYAEKMANKAHVNCTHESMKAGGEVIKTTEKLINQIIADTKAACKEAITNNLSLHPNTWNTCMNAIDRAEIKEQ